MNIVENIFNVIETMNSNAELTWISPFKLDIATYYELEPVFFEWTMWKEDKKKIHKMQDKNDNCTLEKTDSVVTATWVMLFHVQTWRLKTNARDIEKILIRLNI